MLELSLAHHGQKKKDGSTSSFRRRNQWRVRQEKDSHTRYGPSLLMIVNLLTHGQHTKPPLSASPNPPARAVEEMESIKTVRHALLRIAVSDTLQKTANGILRSSPMLPAKDVRESGQPERPNLPDKPLPSLPIATIQRGSPVARRSLIDASEKPLRRSISPSPGAKVEEEWPTLFPSRTTTPNTNQEMGHEAASDPTGSSSGNSSGPFSRPADLERKHVDTCQHKGENTATESPNLRQGSQGVAASTTQSSTSNQTRPTSAPKVEGLKPRKKPSTSLSDAKELSPTAPDRDTLNGGAPTEIGPAKESTPGAIPSTNNNDFSPTIQATAPSQGAARAKARASRLPKRLSAPGPVRSSSSPRRTLSGRSSPYGSVAARLSRDPPLKHDQGDNSAKRPAERAKSHRVGHAVYGANLASDNIPSLVAVKQSSKQGQAEDGRSSIPRPHHRSQPHQDAESETEIVVSKLPRKKLVRNGTTTDHDSDDGDLDTDEGHKGKEGKMIPRASYPPNADKPIGQGPENEGPKMEPNSEAAVAGKAEERLSPAGETSLKAISDNQQVYRSAAADSGSVLDTRLNTSRQTPLIEKPFDRVKRLSEAAPEHGPVLRISDSADRIIMGYGSEDNFGDDETPARKRNSVPDLRRSVVVKELRKSTEGLLNGHPPLSRSSTNRSLSRNELKEQVGEAWDVRRHSDSLSEPQSVVFKGKAPRSEDPFSTWDGTGTVHTHKIARKPTPHAPLDWPLRPSLQTLVELHPVKEDSCEDSASWISPLQAPRTAMVSEHKSTSPSNNGRESQSRATGASGSASKRPYLQASHSSDREDTNSLATGDKSMLGTSNRGRSAAQNNAQYPPRTSSRVNTPDISVRPRAQIYHPSSRGIPNRFDSAHPRRLSEDFSLPKSITVDSDIFRNSIHKLKDTDKSDFATPAARETSRVQLSSAKGMLSNIKGLFHKRSIETPAPLTAKSKVSDPYERHGTVAINGSPYPNHHSRTLPAKYGAHKGAQGGASIVPTPRDAFPKTACREPPSPRLDSADYRQATDLAMSVLDAAQTEHDAPKRARLVQVNLQPFVITETNADPTLDYSSPSSWLKLSTAPATQKKPWRKPSRPLLEQRCIV